MIIMPPVRCLEKKEALEMFFGIPPHNIKDNLYWGDNYFANDIEYQFQKSIMELCRETGVPYYGELLK